MSEDRYIPTDELHHDSYTYRGKLITDLQRQLTTAQAENERLESALLKAQTNASELGVSLAEALGELRRKERERE